MRVALLAIVAACGRLGFDAGGDGGAPNDAARSSASYMGSVLFVEPFEDLNFTARGWYDGSGGLLSTTEHAPGSSASFQCRWAALGSSCLDGTSGRVLVPATDPLYASYWLKVSSGFGGLAGSLNLLTNADGMFVGPFSSHLDVTLDFDSNRATVQTTDSLDVDPSCVQTAPSSGAAGGIVGCGGGTPATYTYGVTRGLDGCNGSIPSDVVLTWCDPQMVPNTYLNCAFRTSTGTPFTDNTWHFVEVFVAMNSIVGGVDQPDGVLRYWIDGALAVSSDQIRFRTGAEPTMAWNQLAMLPYMTFGAPAAQSMWLDALTVAVGVR